MQHSTSLRAITMILPRRQRVPVSVDLNIKTNRILRLIQLN